MQNLSPFPWTTGAVMVIKKTGDEKRPISQDELRYTPIKGKTYVKLTEAPDIKVKAADRQIDREMRIRKMYPGNPSYVNYYYDLATVEAQVKVKNYKDKDVKMNVRRLIVGELLKSDVKWQENTIVNMTGDINTKQNVTWEFDVKAGEEVIITYSYKLYVPAQ